MPELSAGRQPIGPSALIARDTSGVGAVYYWNDPEFLTLPWQRYRLRKYFTGEILIDHTNYLIDFRALSSPELRLESVRQ